MLLTQVFKINAVELFFSNKIHILFFWFNLENDVWIVLLKSILQYC